MNLEAVAEGAGLVWLLLALTSALAGAAIVTARARVAEAAALRAALARREADFTREYGRAERADEARAAGEDALEALREERAGTLDQLARSQAQCGALKEQIEALRVEMRKDREAAQREVATLREMREEMSRHFRELAAETLRAQGEDLSKVNQERLTALLAPFKDHVGLFQEELRAVHRSADEERGRLREQIAQLHRRSEEISQEAVNLTRALKGDKRKQGAWGEMILERLLEDSGLERNVHYEAQGQRRDEDGKAWRPDVVVRLPRGKALVIDSKVSLVAYEAAVNAATEGERAEQAAAHVAALRRHVETLAAKGYHALERGAVDYVLMFVPVEGALSEALRVQGDLTSYALRKGVGIVTPTTLMVTLRTVEHIWAVERRESNAEEIADRAGKLYEKVCGFVSEMEKAGDCLRKAKEAHDAAYDRLSRGNGNVLGQVEKLKKLGARTVKALPPGFDEEEERGVLTLCGDDASATAAE